MKRKEREKVSIVLVSMYIILIILNAVWYMNGNHIKDVQSFGEALYFSIVTITTLGYGEMYPISSLGRTMVSIEAMSGVVLLGIFLINISLTVVEDKERKRIETMKLSFKEQYKIWRENTVNALVFLTKSQSGYATDDIEKLYDIEEFKKYFKKNDSEMWYKVSMNLSPNEYHTKQILHELEFLQRNIETFIMQVPIENIETLNIFNRYISRLSKMRKHDLSDYEEHKTFIRTLWELVSLFNWSTGYGKNYLLEAIESA